MNQFRPNKERARMAIVMIWIVLALEILSLVSEFFAYDTVGTVSEELSMSDLRQAAIGLLHFIAYVISAITFIQWFRRAYYNLHMVPYSNVKYSEGWAAGCWFVPIMNLFRPYEIMTEMYGKTQRLLSDNRPTSQVGWWWAFWIIANVLGSISTQITFRDGDAGAASIFSMLSSLATIPAAILVVQVIRQYSEMEDRIPETAGQITGQ